MRFEPIRIQLKAPGIFLHTSVRFHLPRLRLRKPSTQLTVPPPELLRRVPEDIEVRPTGFDKYARRFTKEGGIELRYKDVESTLPIMLAKIFVWGMAAFLTYRFGKAYSPFASAWWNGLILLVLVAVYALAIFRDRVIERRVEIRPDCMIIEGMDIFWKENMQLGWPGFMPNEADHFVLCGVYGTRWIEFLTIQRFDPNDRAPELFAAQLTAAMQSQWELPSKGV